MSSMPEVACRQEAIPGSKYHHHGLCGSRLTQCVQNFDEAGSYFAHLRLDIVYLFSHTHLFLFDHATTLNLFGSAKEHTRSQVGTAKTTRCKYIRSRNSGRHSGICPTHIQVLSSATSHCLSTCMATTKGSTIATYVVQTPNNKATTSSRILLV